MAPQLYCSDMTAQIVGSAEPQQSRLTSAFTWPHKHSRVVRGRQRCDVSRWQTEAKKLSNLSACLLELRIESGPSSSSPTASPPSAA